MLLVFVFRPECQLKDRACAGDWKKLFQFKRAGKHNISTFLALKTLIVLTLARVCSCTYNKTREIPIKRTRHTRHKTNTVRKTLASISLRITYTDAGHCEQVKIKLKHWWIMWKTRNLFRLHFPSSRPPFSFHLGHSEKNIIIHTLRKSERLRLIRFRTRSRIIQSFASR